MNNGPNKLAVSTSQVPSRRSNGRADCKVKAKRFAQCPQAQHEQQHERELGGRLADRRCLSLAIALDDSATEVMRNDDRCGEDEEFRRRKRSGARPGDVALPDGQLDQQTKDHEHDDVRKQCARNGHTRNLRAEHSKPAQDLQCDRQGSHGHAQSDDRRRNRRQRKRPPDCRGNRERYEETDEQRANASPAKHVDHVLHAHLEPRRQHDEQHGDVAHCAESRCRIEPADERRAEQNARKHVAGDLRQAQARAHVPEHVRRREEHENAGDQRHERTPPRASARAEGTICCEVEMNTGSRAKGKRCGDDTRCDRRIGGACPPMAGRACS
jgi:hypothetical protein